MNKQDRLLEYLYGEMEVQERRSFEQELAIDPELQEELESLRSVRRTLSLATDVEPPVRIITVEPNHLNQRRWLAWAGSAAALIALILAATAYNAPHVDQKDLLLAMEQANMMDEEKWQRRMAVQDSLWQERLNDRETQIRNQMDVQLVAFRKVQQSEWNRFTHTFKEQDLPEFANLFQQLQLQQQQELSLLLTDFWEHWQNTRKADLQTIEKEFVNVYENVEQHQDDMYSIVQSLYTGNN